MSAPRPPEVIIRSAQHPAVKEARRLEADAGARRKEGRAVAWGRHLAIEALAAGIPIERAFLAPGIEDDAEGGRIAKAIGRAAVPVLRVARALLDDIAAGAGDQGIVLVVRRRSTTPDDLLARRPTLLLLAHGVQDPGNLGSMIRSARALGADGMGVLEGSADPWSSRALRAAMGPRSACRSSRRRAVRCWPPCGAPASGSSPPRRWRRSRRPAPICADRSPCSSDAKGPGCRRPCSTRRTSRWGSRCSPRSNPSTCTRPRRSCSTRPGASGTRGPDAAAPRRPAAAIPALRCGCGRRPDGPGSPRTCARAAA